MAASDYTQHNKSQKRKCSVEECQGDHVAKGFCRKHYQSRYSQGKCSEAKCQNPAKTRGLCSKHATRIARYGSPDIRRRVTRSDIEEWVDRLLAGNSVDCVIWPFSRYKNGYGKWTYEGSNMMAHRVICTMLYGPPPANNYQSAHSCGKGHEGCVNPKHLRWATPAENAFDKIAHNTINRGRKNGSCKLTENQVREIRALDGARTQREIAERYGVSEASIRDILMRKNWGWLT